MVKLLQVSMFCAMSYSIYGSISSAKLGIQMAPWQVSIRQTRYSTANKAHFCSGSWIAEDWVLTAAHCLWDNPKVPIEGFPKLRLRCNQDLAKQCQKLKKIECKKCFPYYRTKNSDSQSISGKLWVAFGEGRVGGQSGQNMDRRIHRSPSLRLVKEAIIHYNYKGKGDIAEHDIALLKLKAFKYETENKRRYFISNWKYNKIAFINLPFMTIEGMNQNVKCPSLLKTTLEKLHVTGYVSTTEDKDNAQNLRQGEVRAYMNNERKKKYCVNQYIYDFKKAHKSNKSPQIKRITDNMICAIGNEAIDKRDSLEEKMRKFVAACSGDSGGPLVTELVNNNGSIVQNPIQLGIVSFGNAQDNCFTEDFEKHVDKAITGVYTRVCKYRDWILDTIVGTTCENGCVRCDLCRSSNGKKTNCWSICEECTQCQEKSMRYAQTELLSPNNIRQLEQKLMKNMRNT